MWRDKKPDTPQPAGPEPKSAQMNQPSKPAMGFLERLTRTSREAMRSTGVTAWLGPSFDVKGEISGNEDLLIDGSVEGLVYLDEGKLTVGAAAKVTADIIAREVVVCGNLKGNVHAKGKVEIKKDGAVTGDLTTPQIMIEDGAYFKGSIEIKRSAETEAGKNVPSGTQSEPTTLTAAGVEPKSLST